MKQVIQHRQQGLRGTIAVPGDKSISHRAVMFAALAEGTTTISGFLRGADCLSTIRCMRQLGVRIEETDNKIIIYGNGLYGLREPDDILDVGNSGTTIRMLMGILVGQDFYTTLTGDHSIRKRPMRRVIEPLSQMGAQISGRQGGTCAPITINGVKTLRAIEYYSPVASAQVKSAILLAGLYANGGTTVIEPVRSRDHTEHMLKAMGARLAVQGCAVSIEGGSRLKALPEIEVPGDISSAAFMLVAASIVPESELLLTSVGVNETRTGILDVLVRMGADIMMQNVRNVGGEQVADLRVRSASLKGTDIEPEIIPRLVDEIPVLAVAAAVANGKTTIRGAGELRVKESDRLKAVTEHLSKMGANITELPDGLIIEGSAQLRGIAGHSGGDHRMAMSLAVAGLAASGETYIDDAASVDVSFPGFFELFKTI